jgi:hypothetical protein
MAALPSPTHVINRTMHILGPRSIGITTNIHYYRMLSNNLCYAFSSVVQLLTTSEIPLWNSKSSNCLRILSCLHHITVKPLNIGHSQSVKCHQLFGGVRLGKLYCIYIMHTAILLYLNTDSSIIVQSSTYIYLNNMSRTRYKLSWRCFRVQRSPTLSRWNS